MSFKAATMRDRDQKRRLNQKVFTLVLTLTPEEAALITRIINKMKSLPRLLTLLLAFNGHPAASTLVCARPFLLTFAFMSKPANCPMCEMNEILEHAERYECVTCGHEWPRQAEAAPADAPRVVKDAHGNVLADGDCVVLIKDLKLGGSSVLKGGSKSKPIRLVDGDHEIDCKVDGIGVRLKACFVKKA